MARRLREPDVVFLQNDYADEAKDEAEVLDVKCLDQTALLDCASELALRQIDLVLKDSKSREIRKRVSVAAFVFHEQDVLKYYCMSLLIHLGRSGSNISLCNDVSFLGHVASISEDSETIILKGIVKCVAQNLCTTAESEAAKDKGSVLLKNWVLGMGKSMTHMPYLFQDVKALANGQLPYDFFTSNKKKRGAI